MATTIPKGTVQGQNQKDTVSGATQVTKNAHLIIAQATIDTIKEIPNLPTHQNAAKVQARKWNDTVWPLITTTTADIIDYANTFQATYQALIDLIPQLEKGHKSAHDKFTKELQDVLISILQTKSKTAKSIRDSISKFHDDFQPLYNSFQTDFKAADHVMTQDNTDIIDKKADLENWNGKALSYEWSAVALGIAVPIIATGMAIAAESVVMIPIGAILLIGDVSAIGIMLGLYADAMHHVNDLTNEISKLNTQVSQLTNIEKQITNLQKYTKEVVTTSASVADGWDALEKDMNETIDHLKTITPEKAALFIKTELTAANKEWGITLDQAKVLQPNGGALALKTYNSSADMIKALDDQAKGA